jgi:hypothetical protein
MSVLGHKQTFAVRKGMSALPPKADICGATSDVRFGAEADNNVRKIPLDQFCAKPPFVVCLHDLTSRIRSSSFGNAAWTT